jgi:hypothetical protein
LTCFSRPAQYRARSAFLSTLPTEVNGSSASNPTVFGAQTTPLRCVTKSISSRSSTRAPGFRTTSAVTASPHLSCGTPITADAATAGCSARQFSTSLE